MKRFLYLMMILGAAALLAAGCSSDDPARPDPDPEPDPVATTPDSLMALYRTAIEDMDLALYDQILSPDFTLAVSAWEGSFDDLPTDHMTRSEVLTSAANMFGGAEVTNWMGYSVPAVTRVTIHQWEQVTGWVSPAAAGAAGDMPPAPVVSSIWALRMYVERGTGYPLLAVAGEYIVTAWQHTVDEGVEYRLSSMQILEETGAAADKSETFGWAGAHLVYMTNEGPTAALEVTETPTDGWPKYIFDPSSSTDEDSGLADLPYRYREGPEIFIGDPGWTQWTADPFEAVFTSEEVHTVTVEVRDRWGWTAQATKPVTPVRAPLPFPGTPNQLMANFRLVYEDMDYGDFRKILHPDFRTVLQQETIDQFPDVGEYLDFDEESRIAQRMFSGEDLTDPNGEFVPGVAGIAFNRFEPMDAWRMSPADDPIPNAYFAPFDVDILFNRGQGHSYMSVKGQIRFYATSRDSLYEGEVRDYYQMAGQVDLTGVFKAVEESSWGSVKALYR